MTSHCITWHHIMTWPPHHLTPQQTLRHQNTWLQSTRHHHRGTAESLCTAKEWFGHGAGRSPCAHSIGKFFLCYILFFLLKLPPPARPGTTCKYTVKLVGPFLKAEYYAIVLGVIQVDSEITKIFFDVGTPFLAEQAISGLFQPYSGDLIDLVAFPE